MCDPNRRSSSSKWKTEKHLFSLKKTLHSPSKMNELGPVSGGNGITLHVPAGLQLKKKNQVRLHNITNL